MLIVTVVTRISIYIYYMIILTFLTGIDGTVGAFKACLADVGTSIIMHGYLVTSSVLQKLG